MRADIHDGREHMLQSEAGYIDARPHLPELTKPLAPHGRTIHWVSCDTAAAAHSSTASRSGLVWRVPPFVGTFGYPALGGKKAKHTFLPRTRGGPGQYRLAGAWILVPMHGKLEVRSRPSRDAQHDRPGQHCNSIGMQERSRT